MIYQVPTIKNSTGPALHKKAVAFCVDKAYLPYASFVAHQIIAKEQNIDFDIVICVQHTDELPKTNTSPIRYCTVDYSSLFNLPVGRLSIATYYKIFLPAIFKEEYDQILYLDADVYINTSCISDLLNNHKDDKGLVMAVDISEIERKSGLNFHNSYLDRYVEIKHQYRNAGVILFNTQKLLQIDYLSQLLDYAQKNKNKLLRHDQTLLNTVLYDQISSLSFLYNYQLIDATIPLLEEFNPKILHFVGELKPWNTEHRFIGTFYTEYLTFIQQYFPNYQLCSKSEFDLKYESRVKKKKYKNPIREQLSLKVFVGKQRLQRTIAYFTNPTDNEPSKGPKISRILIRFRKSIDLSICECEIRSVHSL